MNNIQVTKGFRGYVFSRPFFGHRIPQHIQNTIIRDYCKRNKLHFLLSVTEYKMDDSHLMLNKVIRGLDDIDGLIFYSIFQLPADSNDRIRLMTKIIDSGKTIHFASEKIVLATKKTLNQIEMMLQVEKSLASCPTAEDVVNLFAFSALDTPYGLSS